jgi:hypothetical protein
MPRCSSCSLLACFSAMCCCFLMQPEACRSLELSQLQHPHKAFNNRHQMLSNCGVQIRSNPNILHVKSPTFHMQEAPTFYMQQAQHGWPPRYPNKRLHCAVQQHYLSSNLLRCNMFQLCQLCQNLGRERSLRSSARLSLRVKSHTQFAKTVLHRLY